MTQSGHLVSRRIRKVKSSLESAEQSFLDNKDLRGELDLMLAEAELKNLCRKKNVPWNWNRQFLAICSAILLLLAGLGGWYIGKDYYEKASVENPINDMKVINNENINMTIAKEVEEVPISKSKDIADNNSKKELDHAFISKSDLHKLVQSARVELSSSK